MSGRWTADSERRGWSRSADESQCVSQSHTCSRRDTREPVPQFHQNDILISSFLTLVCRPIDMGTALLCLLVVQEVVFEGRGCERRVSVLTAGGTGECGWPAVLVSRVMHDLLDTGTRDDAADRRGPGVAEHVLQEAHDVEDADQGEEE